MPDKWSQYAVKDAPATQGGGDKWAQYAVNDTPAVTQTPSAAANPPTATMQASSPQPWTTQLQEDLRQGGGRTFVGRTLGYMQGRGNRGYTGLEGGVTPGEANFVGSVPLGAAKVAQSWQELPQHPLKSMWDSATGAAQMATIPASLMAPEATEAGAAMIPTRARAGQLFSEVEQAAKGQPVTLTRTLPYLERAQQLSARSHGTVGALDNLYNRVNTVNPLDYVEARDRASALSNLTGQDKLNATKMLTAQAKNVSHAFNQDIGDTAAAVGKGQQYQQAMNMYRQAARNAEIAKKVGLYGAGTVATGAGVEGLYQLGKKLF